MAKNKKTQHFRPGYAFLLYSALKQWLQPPRDTHTDTIALIVSIEEVINRHLNRKMNLIKVIMYPDNQQYLGDAEIHWSIL